MGKTSCKNLRFLQSWLVIGPLKLIKLYFTVSGAEKLEMELKFSGVWS